MQQEHDQPGMRAAEQGRESIETLLQRLLFIPALHSKFNNKLAEQIAYRKIKSRLNIAEIQKYPEPEILDDKARLEFYQKQVDAIARGGIPQFGPISPEEADLQNEQYILEQAMYNLRDYHSMKKYCENTPGFEECFPDEDWIRNEIENLLATLMDIDNSGNFTV